jgi:predicted CoA-binding protein
MNEPETICQILKESKTIAVVGLSAKYDRASFAVSHYMQSQGYRIIPVNPSFTSVLGEDAYPTLEAACAANGKIDLVDVFRAPQYVPDIVEDVIRLKIPYLWLQEGVCHQQAAERAQAAGIKVVMDHCIFREHAHIAAIRATENS